MKLDDQSLLELLGDAYPIDRREPPPANVAQLREHVAHHFGPGRITRLRGRVVRGAAPFVVAGGVLASAGTAAAATGNLPRPVRAVAHNIGLPVASPELSDTRADARRLERAIERNDLGGIERHAVALRDHLGGLDPSERERIAGRAEQMLAKAQTATAAPLPAPGPGPDPKGGPPVAPASTPTTGPVPTTAPPPPPPNAGPPPTVRPKEPPMPEGSPPPIEPPK